MSGTHSSTMAEERLFPSTQAHQTSTTTITPKARPSSGKRKLTATTLGHGPGHVTPLSAFEVPRSKRLLQVSLAAFYCLLAAGVIFGYAAIKPVLIQEGVYSELCTKQEVREGVRVCYQQEIRLNFMFTIAAVATNVCALAVGTILDRFGPKLAASIGCVFFAIGCACFGLGKDIRALGIDPYPFSYLLMALAGPFIFIPSFHLANAFPSRSGLILSILTGAFDSSSAVFLVYRLLYNHFNGISLRKWFLSYLIVPAFILIVQIFMMPRQSYKTPGELSQLAQVQQGLADRAEEGRERERRESLVSEIEGLLGAEESGLKERGDKVEKKRADSGVWGVMHGKSLREQIGSFWFWGIALFTLIQMTRINYFISTIRPQYDHLLPKHSVHINHLFDLLLPLCGIMAVPFIGTILDGLATLTVLTLLVTTATTIGVLGLIPNSLPAAYGNIILFSLYRPFYYTVVSDYCVKVFGVANFGRIYGTVIMIAGVFGLGQTGLDWITVVVMKGDPTIVNAVLMGAGALVGASLIAFVSRKGKQARRKMLGQEARKARHAEEQDIWIAQRQQGYGTV